MLLLKGIDFHSITPKYWLIINIHIPPAVSKEASCCYVVVAEETFKEMVGPGVKDQWLYWTSQTATQQRRQAVAKELEKLLNSNEVSWASHFKTFWYAHKQVCAIWVGGWGGTPETSFVAISLSVVHKILKSTFRWCDSYIHKITSINFIIIISVAACLLYVDAGWKSCENSRQFQTFIWIDKF